jgi:hypothetical protein
MNNHEPSFGTPFERIFMGFMSIITGIILIFLAIKGPLFLNQIKYKTAEILNNQLIGQDLVNLFLLSVILIASGVALFFKKQISKYLLIVTPLYLIYYVLSYTIGWEWSSPKYSGNSQGHTFYFLFILIASLLILLYSLSIFPKKVESRFRKKPLMIYSVLFSFFLLVFASMWVKEVLEVMATGTTRAYDIAPTAFWVVRIFDLGFSIPLGLLSVYLLWTRPNTTYPVQFLFYGFFLTMIIAVNAMGLVMYFNRDPTFMMRDLVVFIILALIVFSGFIYIHKNYRIITDKQSL